MLVKETRKLFKGTYQYKVVLVSPGCTFFRNGDIAATLEVLQLIETAANIKRTKFKSLDDVTYAVNIAKALAGMQDYEVRVEYPLLTIYATSQLCIDTLTNLDKSKVKYISIPPKDTSLVEGTVIMPKIDFDFKVTLGRTKQNNSTFIAWADNNAKVKLTNSARRDLHKNTSWGGTHFYASGDNTLLMIRMMLGGSINKVENIVKK